MLHENSSKHADILSSAQRQAAKLEAQKKTVVTVTLTIYPTPEFDTDWHEKDKINPISHVLVSHTGIYLVLPKSASIYFDGIFCLLGFFCRLQENEL